MSNAIVYRCVRMIAEAAASVPLCLYDGPTELDSHPLLDLLARPSPHSTRAEFIESLLGYLLVSGNSYVEAVALNGQVRELYPLRPDRITIIPGNTGWPEGYQYTAAGGQVTYSGNILPDVRPLLHTRLFHPLDDHYGFSPIEAAATAIDIHNQASKWNKALLDNAARPSGALVYAAREGRLSPEQFERLKNELQEGFSGAKNAGRPLLLEGGLDWKPLSLTPAELDFINTKHAAAREIALALGVPPMLLGIPGDNTYSNYAEANRTFWRNTVIPLVTRATSALADWLSPAYSDTPLTLIPDLDQVDALAPEREALWSRLQATTFLTDDEKRAAIGYGPKRVVKFNPGQPRVPSGSSEGGQWVGDNHGDVHLINGRRPRGTIPVFVGGRTYYTTNQIAAELEAAALRAARALETLRARDPDWRPTPSIYESATGALAHYRNTAQEAEARLQVLERGNLPLGFNSKEQFEIFGYRTRSSFRDAGYEDAVPYIRGSAVTGHKYTSGSPFDSGRTSDYDLAIVSPSLMRRAEHLGIRFSGNRSRPLNGQDLIDLGLEGTTLELNSNAGREVKFMIYSSRADIVRRGPFIQLP